MENEANRFAVALLMPAADIRPYFFGRRIDLSLLAALKPEWKVSMAALLMRAHKLKFLSDSQHTYLWKQISARGYRLREPPETDFPHERPEVLEKIIRLHLQSLGYTDQDLSKILHMHEREIRSLYGIGEIPKRGSRITILK